MPRCLPARLHTPLGLAGSPEFRNGAWRDGQGRGLYAALVADLGRLTAQELWLAACRLFDEARKEAA